MEKLDYKKPDKCKKYCSSSDVCKTAIYWVLCNHFIGEIKKDMSIEDLDYINWTKENSFKNIWKQWI